VEMLNRLDSFAIQFPAGFDVSRLTNFNFSGSDFRGTTGLKISLLNQAPGLGIRLPTGFNVSGLTNPSFQGLDLTGTTGFTIGMLNSAEHCFGIVLPSGFDVSELTNTELSGLDLSHTVGLKAEAIRAASQVQTKNGLENLTQMKLPANADLGALDFTGVDLSGIQF